MKHGSQTVSKKAYQITLLIFLVFIPASCKTPSQVPEQVKQLAQSIQNKAFKVGCDDSYYHKTQYRPDPIEYGIMEMKAMPELLIKGKEASGFDKEYNNKQWEGKISFKLTSRYRKFHYYKESKTVTVSDWELRLPIVRDNIIFSVDVRIRNNKLDYKDYPSYLEVDCSEVQMLKRKIAENGK